jgi:hypothetical protein
MSDNSTSYSSHNAANIAYKFYPEDRPTGLAGLLTSPVAGLYHSIADPIISVKYARKENTSFLTNAIKFYPPEIAGYAATRLLVQEPLKYTVAGLTGTQLSQYMLNPYPLIVGGTQITGGTPLGIATTAMAPYILPATLGIYLMYSGAKQRKMWKVGVGAGAATASLFDVFGSHYVASQSIMGALGFGVSTVTGILGSLALIGMGYKVASRMIQNRILSKGAKESTSATPVPKYEQSTSSVPPAAPAEKQPEQPNYISGKAA